MYPTTPPRPPAGASMVIDCESCPVRGRHCDDCFVPVLGTIWLSEPAVRQSTPPLGPAETAEQTETPQAAEPAGAGEPAAGRALLDSDELAAVSAFVRAGLVAPEDAQRAVLTVSPGQAATG